MIFLWLKQRTTLSQVVMAGLNKPNQFCPHNQKCARKNLRAAKKIKIFSPYFAGNYEIGLSKI